MGKVKNHITMPDEAVQFFTELSEEGQVEILFQLLGARKERLAKALEIVEANLDDLMIKAAEGGKDSIAHQRARNAHKRAMRLRQDLHTARGMYSLLSH